MAAKIFMTLWALKKEGHSDITLEVKGERLRYLAKHVNLDDPEAVKGYIATRASWSNAYRQAVAYAYNSYVEVNGLRWSLPHFRVEDKLPKIPTEEKINQIIVRARGKYVLVFSVLRDAGMRPIELERGRARDINLDIGVITVRARAGMRPIELERTKVRDIDFDRGIIAVRTAKDGLGRSLKVRAQTLAMLKEHLGKHDFGLNDCPFPKRKKMTGRWVRLRNTVAEKLKDATFRTIRLYDLRHFVGTMTYHKTKEIVYTQRKLGHRSLRNTIRYVQLMDFEDDEFTSAVARTLKEACQLIEARAHNGNR